MKCVRSLRSADTLAHLLKTNCNRRHVSIGVMPSKTPTYSHQRHRGFPWCLRTILSTIMPSKDPSDELQHSDERRNHPGDFPSASVNILSTRPEYDIFAIFLCTLPCKVSLGLRPAHTLVFTIAFPEHAPGFVAPPGVVRTLVYQPPPSSKDRDTT